MSPSGQIVKRHDSFAPPDQVNFDYGGDFYVTEGQAF